MCKKKCETKEIETLHAQYWMIHILHQVDNLRKPFKDIRLQTLYDWVVVCSFILCKSRNKETPDITENCSPMSLSGLSSKGRGGNTIVLPVASTKERVLLTGRMVVHVYVGKTIFISVINRWSICTSFYPSNTLRLLSMVRKILKSSYCLQETELVSTI